MSGAARSDRSEPGQILAPHTFDSRSVPSQELFDCLNDALAFEGLRFGPKDPIGTSVEATSRTLTLGQIYFRHAYSRGHIGRVSKGSHYENLHLRLYLGGTIRLWGDGVNFNLKQGDIFIDTYQSDTFFDVEDLSSFSIVVPLHLLDLDRQRFSRPICVGRGTLAHRLLLSAMETAEREMGRLSRAEAGLMEASVISLLRSILQQDPAAAEESPDYRRTRSHAIRDFIDTQLADPELGTGSICRAFNVGRTTVYREFEAEGGITRVISGRRLERALNLLAQGPALRGRIAEVAASVGYSDPFHFSKAFRKHFGFRPSDVLALGDLADVSVASRSPGTDAPPR